jgi:XTP/dITP diphosphohydrolase
MGRPPADRQPLVLATRNRHKLAEVTRLLAPMGLTVEPLPDGIELPPEDGDTFEANAVPKAQAAAAATGRSAIADDSGIEAAALDGRPGVRSARYAGESATDEENLLKLMDEAPVGSALRYVCALAFVDPSDGEERVFVGECRGRLAGERRGARGFGYDPAFLPDEDPALAPGAASALAPASGERDGRARTMSELSEAEKDAISHRGHALRAFAEWYLS